MIPKSLEKLLKFENYDKIRDSNERIEHVDTMSDYHNAKNIVKCKLLMLTLKEPLWHGLKPYHMVPSTLRRGSMMNL